MLKLVYLTEAFYNDHPGCDEIEQKDKRPYIRIHVVVGGVLWGIPLRSHITHEHVLWTDKENRCGIDFSKAVVIEKPAKYISGKTPYIRPNEHKVLKTFDEYRIVQRMQKYIKEYKEAKQHSGIKRNKQLLECSTLQYFEDYI